MSVAVEELLAALVPALAPKLESMLNAALEKRAPAVAAAVEKAEPVVNAIVGAMPAGQILPHADDGASEIATAAGRAALAPQQVTAGDAPAEADQSLPDVYARLAAVEAKLNALVAATGMAGSAAMAGHP